MKTADIIIKKNIATNQISFFKNGKQVFPLSISGNIVKFSTGETILI